MEPNILSLNFVTPPWMDAEASPSFGEILKNANDEWEIEISKAQLSVYAAAVADNLYAPNLALLTHAMAESTAGEFSAFALGIRYYPLEAPEEGPVPGVEDYLTLYLGQSADIMAKLTRASLKSNSELGIYLLVDGPTDTYLIERASQTIKSWVQMIPDTTLPFFHIVHQDLILALEGATEEEINEEFSTNEGDLGNINLG